MEAIQATFARCARERRPAFVTYVTAWYPAVEETVGILMGMEAGSADIIEIGLPCSDPLTDGPIIQNSHAIALENGITMDSVFEIVRQARERSLSTPILLMGYHQSVLDHGGQRLLKECRRAGVDGILLAEMPPEKAVKFRSFCADNGLSYIPVITPATSEKHVKLLSKLAESFVYLVSGLGVTGTSGAMSPRLPPLLRQIEAYSNDLPVALGFGFSTRADFLRVAQIADGIMIGSQIIRVLAEAQRVEAVEAYCVEVSGRHETMNSH